jgi:multicomponent Na+:H+ antiporter subunit G
MNEIGLAIIALGVLFNFLGCLGMVRFPDLYNRLQAGTKCVTLGVCLILLGTILVSESYPTQLKAVLCAVFILTTSPVAAHALARAARLSGIPLWKESVVDQFERE